MELLLILVLVGVSLYHWKFKKDDKKPDEIWKASEEHVLNVQSKFEDKIKDTELPDAISGKEIYVYQNLMKPWYKKLSATNRYNEVIAQGLRNDWIEYIDALRKMGTCSFMGSEASTEEKREQYQQDGINALQKSKTIEDAFATMMGDSTADELKKIREIDSFEFEDDGRLK